MTIPDPPDTTLREELTAILVDRSSGTEDSFSDDNLEELLNKIGKLATGTEGDFSADSDSTEIDYHDTQF